MIWIKAVFFSAALCWSSEFLFIPENQVQKELPYTLEALFEKIKSYPSFEAEYTQQKTLPALKKPLESSGVFSFKKGMGFEIRQVKPNQTKTLITPSEIQVTDSYGQKTVISTKSNAQAKNLSAMLENLFNGNAFQNHDQFDLWYEVEASKVILGLKPKSLIARNYLESIIIEFVKQKVVKMTIKENTRAITTWVFQNQSQIK